MGLQLGIHESSNIILKAIDMVGDNLGVNFYHKYSAPGNQGFFVEINDLTTERKLAKISSNYDVDDHVFTLNIPYEYFNDDQLPEDNNIGIKLTDHTEVKAELRCMNLITKIYQNWIKHHEVFTSKDLLAIINEAIIKLEQVKKLNLMADGGKTEIAEKYININFTEEHISAIGGSYPARFFPVAIPTYFYYENAGQVGIDKMIGEKALQKMTKHDICLLRITYQIYNKCINWLKLDWPDVYQDYLKGKL